MNPWKRIHNEFKALRDEEYGIVQQREARECCYAYVTYGESGEFSCWVESIADESLHAGFEVLATEAGFALGSPSGTVPHMYWLHQLFLELRATHSNHVHLYSGTGGMIERLFEACALYCARLDRRFLEKAVMPCESTAAVAEVKPRRGYRTEVRQWMELEGVDTLDLAAKRLRISLSGLKSIMSERGIRKYGDALLTRILESIGYKGE